MNVYRERDAIAVTLAILMRVRKLAASLRCTITAINSADLDTPFHFVHETLPSIGTNTTPMEAQLRYLRSLAQVEEDASRTCAICGSFLRKQH